MRIDRPIIIVGTGRCGSTLLHRILANHENVGWLSPYNEVFPKQLWLSALSRLYKMRAFEDVKSGRYFPKPFEAYKFWEYFLPGFSRRDRPQTADDVPANGIEPVREAVLKVLKYQNTTRFLAKVTGWSRIAYFDRIFPDALFIFLNREHRSVVSSWVRAGWLDMTSGLESESWQWGEVPSNYYQLWRELGGSPLLSAAIKIKLDLDDIHRNMAQFGERCFKLQYEDLISEPNRYLREVAQFCKLPWTSQFEASINRIDFYNPTEKWKKHLTEQEGDLIVEFFERADRVSAAGVSA
jgi:hypothetical protein